jgi:hypothetical protein
VGNHHSDYAITAWFNYVGYANTSAAFSGRAARKSKALGVSGSDGETDRT